MNDRVLKRLLDAHQACVHIHNFVDGKSFEDYEQDFRLQLQVERLLEIVGEALNRARQDDPALTEQIPELSRIIGLRNRIIHGYDTVDDELVWLAATYHAKRLQKALEHLIRAGTDQTIELDD
jgi:uncharacterized protein with HEPN domain